MTVEIDSQVQENRVRSVKNLALTKPIMYRHSETKFATTENFTVPFEEKLATDNRWVIMSKLIPWAEFEAEYAIHFSTEGMGAPAKPFRMALGGLIIKERLKTSDRETVEQIRENPYLQYFIGMKEYSNKEPFEASMLVHFRQRIGEELVNKINKKTIELAQENAPEKKSKKEWNRQITEN
jgi:transposase, IS5 family